MIGVSKFNIVPFFKEVFYLFELLLEDVHFGSSNVAHSFPQPFKFADEIGVLEPTIFKLEGVLEGLAKSSP